MNLSRAIFISTFTSAVNCISCLVARDVCGCVRSIRERRTATQRRRDRADASPERLEVMVKVDIEVLCVEKYHTIVDALIC
ncbi:hypothetical protein BC826DRAFT_1053929 [Russula brevipes]|nr:hypothetical protein BC826DRAFT_1053929 [Russula brevipes]